MNGASGRHLRRHRLDRRRLEQVSALSAMWFLSDQYDRARSLDAITGVTDEVIVVYDGILIAPRSYERSLR